MEIEFYEMGHKFVVDVPSGKLTYSLIPGEKIERNGSGNVIRIGKVNIDYNYKGNVIQIGKVRIQYSYSDIVYQIGNLRISYDYKGNVQALYGKVN